MCRFLSKLLITLGITIAAQNAFCQGNTATSPGNGNPLIPGYFADPTVRKFGDTFYIYATTDGNGGGHGPSQVWTSKDFVNWKMRDMNWPVSNYYWAPDVINGNDHKYYMYYCQPVDIYGASATSPTGPWTPLLPGGKPMIPNYFVPGVITLDGQTFKDDDGKIYMFWGTWGTYPDHGCGVGLLNADMHTFSKKAKIPNTIAKDFFEAPFMFKRKGIYYLTYSSGFCENETYRVQYAMSKKGPMGPFVFGKNNPVLSTSSDGTVHGPGHESVIQVGDDFYMVYHRHNNPHSNGGYHRQVCADKILFDTEGNIKKLIPTHTGVGPLGKPGVKTINLAYRKTVTASSYYNDDYRPSFAADDNNGTLWRPARNDGTATWLKIDLGAIKSIRQVLTQFEYATWYYQYKIETSADGLKWNLFADKTHNQQHGSPMIDNGDVKARYVRLIITGTEYPGLFKSIWNIKIYSDKVIQDESGKLAATGQVDSTVQKRLLVSFDADSLQQGEFVPEFRNKGALGGTFVAGARTPYVDIIKGKKALVFNGSQNFESTAQVPRTLCGNNSYTVAYTIYSSELLNENPVLSWTAGESEHRGAIFGYGKNRDFGVAQHFGVSDFPFAAAPSASAWHQIVITYDGVFEKVFVDGVLNNKENKMLFMQAADKIFFGSKTNKSLFLNAAVSSLKVYDIALPDSLVESAFNLKKTTDIPVYLDAGKLSYGKLFEWVNNGSLGGKFVASGNASPVVKDVGGKIAVAFSGSDNFNFYKVNDGISGVQSLILSVFLPDSVIYNDSQDLKNELKGRVADRKESGGKWHLLVRTKQSGEVTYFLDGVKVIANSRIDDLFKTLFANTSKGKGFKYAISTLTCLAQSLTTSDIRQITDIWFKNIHPVNLNPPYFVIPPHAVSPTLIEMTAAADTEGKQDLQYYFQDETNNALSEEWRDDPHYTNFTVVPDHIYAYRFKVKDNFGNVSRFSDAFTVSTSQMQFNVTNFDFSTQTDTTNIAAGNSSRSGATGLHQAGPAGSVYLADKSLILKSKGSNWDGNQPYGPFIYKTIAGDFIAETEVADLSGFKEKAVRGNNDVGLMVRKAVTSDGKNTQEALLQNSLFPAWNCGNLFTNLQSGQRIQTNTQSGWNFNRYLQIQRSGNTFYIRSSADGRIWRDMPGSPVSRTDLDTLSLQVGLFQSSYGPQEGFGSFKSFKIIQKK
ncbi:concanavalin A-like lectin/glucanase superfamily protein [Mucilaginibacter gracilis]|uniref:Concanavalin A-like lectin/glucanase superfamily protein n=1 Tax=Mucilaginibacter gracilis TaxID=423350 RepID=A0A495IV70_9SPHI|nr:family 43 glycosylhydrolase [Mucilaginibacter gracilis]RKR80482.1 concanavalin A-like lectin/glucanase superfamily protein [Mucilaginibacter gracilis]